MLSVSNRQPEIIFFNILSVDPDTIYFEQKLRYLIRILLCGSPKRNLLSVPLDV